MRVAFRQVPEIFFGHPQIPHAASYQLLGFLLVVPANGLASIRATVMHSDNAFHLPD